MSRRGSGSSECWLLGFLEQRKEYRHNFFRDDPAVQVLLGEDKLLSAEQADRDHHLSASLELVDQGRWVLGPAQIAVRDADFDVGVALSLQPLHCSLRQLIDDFDAVYPAG